MRTPLCKIGNVSPRDKANIGSGSLLHAALPLSIRDMRLFVACPQSGRGRTFAD
jgi:hypothetical protein